MTKKQLLFLILSLSTTVNAYAEEKGVARQSADIISYADIFQWMLALLVVLGVFGFLIWLLRKSGSLSFAGKNQLSVISGLSLGMREKLVLVKVGEKQILLGVTPGRVDMLLELEGDDRLFQNPQPENGGQLFAKKLQQVLQGKADG